MARSKSSKQWLQEHFRDEFVQKSWKEGYRSRATYKLIEIQEKDKLIRPGQVIVDLGAAPGGWSQYAADILRNKKGELNGKIIGLDILPIDPMDGVTFIQGDFRDDSVLEQLMAAISNYNGIDLVISDMAPNTSGMKAIDQPRSMYLVELAYDFAVSNLKPGGGFLCKVFHGAGFDEFVKTTRQQFKRVTIRKPKASRARSVETYLLASELKNDS
ncbi:MAG: 23S rRNA (uridine(2552)-2'-O)-methyltransferase RlmE [Gammaproteobacteria bacterium]|nr:MAG: 23S rRNA (uridine(2552)-2'-O)-methyltransferase RlmE [Gammaproteobacteria bacterium]